MRPSEAVRTDVAEIQRRTSAMVTDFGLFEARVEKADLAHAVQVSP